MAAVALLVGSGLFALRCPAAEAPATPAELRLETLQRWRVDSLIEDVGLRQRNVLDVAFEEDGTAWLAASDGLYRYDGHEVRRFGREQGLPSSFVRAVCWTKERRLWVGTDAGAVAFDGARFDGSIAAGRLAGPSVRRIRQTADGALWFCCDRWPDPTASGGLTRYDGRDWTSYTKADAAPLDHVMDFFRDSRGAEYVLTQTGLLERRGGRWISPLPESGLEGPGETFWSMAEVPGQGLMACTFTAVFRFEQGRWVRYPHMFPLVFAVGSTREGEFLGVGITGRDSCGFKRWDGRRFELESEPFPPPQVNIVFLTQAPDGSIWAGGYDCLVRWDRRGEGWTLIDTPLPRPRIADGLGRIWFADADSAWRLAGDRLEPVEGFAGGELRGDASGGVWGWNQTGLYRWSGRDRKHHRLEELGFEQISDCGFDAQGRVWICGSAGGDRLRVVWGQGESWHPVDLGEYEAHSLSSGAADPEAGMWYVLLDRLKGESHLIHARESGIESHPIVPRLTAFSRIAFAPTRQGGWLYGENLGLFRYTLSGRVWSRVGSLLGSSVRTCVAGSNEVWFVLGGFTGGRAGLARFVGDQCEQFEADVEAWGDRTRDGALYFAGDGCLYGIDQRGFGVPMRIDLPLEGAVRGVVVDEQGSLFVRVGDRVLRHRPRSTAPRASVVCPDVRQDRPLRFTLAASQRFASRTRAHSFRFSHRLDGGPWSPFSGQKTGEIADPGLRVGQHVLEARVQDESYRLSAEVARVAFSVLPVPLQERVWFRPAVAGLFVVVLGLAANLYRASRKLGRYAGDLERTVADRTASLRESEEKYRVLVEHAAEAIFVAQDGRIQFANGKCEELLGYTRQELKARGFLDFVHPEDRALVLGRHTKRLQGLEVPPSYSFRAIDRAGQERWLELNAVPILWKDRSATLNFATDVTERRRAERETADWKRRYDLLSLSAGTIVYDCSSATGAIVWGGGVEALLGYAPAELSGGFEQWKALVHPEDREATLRRFAQAEAQGVAFDAEYRFRHKAGHFVLIHDSGYPLLDDRQRVERYVGVMMDVTGRRQAEEERARLEEQLQQARKMESVGRLAGGVAHDFNNMLQAILGNVDLALLQAKPGTELHEDLREIQKSAQRSAELTRQLLAFARKQTVRPRVLDLNETVSGSLKMLQRLIGENLQLLWAPGRDLWPVKVDPGQIDQILANLAVNARDAIAGAGRVTIETANTTLDAAYARAHADCVPGEYVMLAVRDTGRGMEPGVLAHLFEPFFTTKEVGKGTGLGLATVFGIVKQNAGVIDVESQPGHGTLFRIYLPRSADAGESAAALPAERPMRGTETLLLVEDEEQVLQLARRILEGLGYTLLAAATPERALTLASGHPGPIHLLITDVVMPGMNGKELQQRLGTAYPAMRCLFMSGYTANVIAHHGVLDTGVEFLQKPFTMEALAERVRTLLDRA